MERKQILLKYNEIPLYYYVYLVIPHNNLWDSSHWSHRTEEEIEDLIEDAKVFDCVDHNKLWKILQEMGIPDHFTCLLRNVYAGQEATWTWNNGSKLGKE